MSGRSHTWSVVSCFNSPLRSAVDARVAYMRQRVMPAAQHQQRQRGRHARHRVMAARLREHPAIERRAPYPARRGLPRYPASRNNRTARRARSSPPLRARRHCRRRRPPPPAARLWWRAVHRRRGHAEKILVALAQSGFAGLAEGDLSGMFSLTKSFGCFMPSLTLRQVRADVQ